MVKRKRVSGLLLCSVGMLGPWGCAMHGAKPLTASAFVPANADNSTGSPLDLSPATMASDVLPRGDGLTDSPKKASVLPQPSAIDPSGEIKPLDALQPTTAPAPAAEQDAPSPTASSSATVDSNPSVTTDTAASDEGQGVYMTLGGVVAIVNDKPIYANQVLEPLRREFAVKSRDMNERAFRHFAMEEIDRQFQELVKDELYFAAAYHGLTEEDRKLAQLIAVQIRDERVTAAGGSIEMARRESLAEGEDFDDAMEKEYRRVVHSLYSHRRIEPMIQVSANGMREFYRLNSVKLYGDKDKAQFRVIKIDPQQAGGLQNATDKINALRARAIHGEDFTALASTENDDAFLKRRGGNPADAGDWIERNTYPNDAVESAIWQIEPGQITPVIQANNALYIAKLEAKHIGVTRSFEDQQVQDDIYNRLRQTQVAEISEKSREESLDDGIVDTNADRMQIALDMAMQQYAQNTDRH